MITTSTGPAPCGYCGMFHVPESSACPRVKAIEYFPNGGVKRVEFKTAADYMPAQPTYPAPNSTLPFGPITWGPTYSMADIGINVTTGVS